MKKYQKRILAVVVANALTNGLYLNAHANPTGASVVHGQASFAQPNASTLQITNTPNAIINWQGFSIGKGESTHFIQQNANSRVLNRVTGQSPSAILGHLQSNGKVFVINPNGIVFGQQATVDTAGLIASTLNISNQDFIQGRFNFQGDGGSIDNQGYIRSGKNGEVVFISPDIKNSGIIEAEGGQILLAAGRSITLNSLDNKGISLKVTAPGDTVLNLGQLIADKGSVGLFADIIHHQGRIQSKSLVRGADGKIHLIANSEVTTSKDSVTIADSGEITIKSQDNTKVSGQVSTKSSQQGGRIELLGHTVNVADAKINASGDTGGGEILVGGDYQGKGSTQTAQTTHIASSTQLKANAIDNGKGGRVIVWADGSTQSYGEIQARGGQFGGNGGFVETSGKQFLDLGDFVPDLKAINGHGGTWLLDPTDVTISNASLNTIEAPAGTFNPNGAVATSTIDVADIVAALEAGTNVQINTTSPGAGLGDITIASAINQTVATAASLNLTAGSSIDIAAPISTYGDINFVSGADGSGDIGESASVAITSYNGNISFSSNDNINLNTNGVTLNANNGAILLTAGTGIFGGTIDINNLTANTSVTLTAPGDISQFGSSINSPQLTVIGQTIKLDSGINSFQKLTVEATGNVEVANLGNFAIFNDGTRDGVSSGIGGYVTLDSYGNGTISSDPANGGGKIVSGTINLNTNSGGGQIGNSKTDPLITNHSPSSDISIGKNGSPVHGVFIEQTGGTLDLNSNFYNDGEIYLNASFGQLTINPTINNGANNVHLLANSNVTFMGPADITTTTGYIFLEDTNPLDNINDLHTGSGGLVTLQSQGPWTINSSVVLPTGQDIELKSQGNFNVNSTGKISGPGGVSHNAKLVINTKSNSGATITVDGAASGVLADNLVLLSNNGQIDLAGGNVTFNTLFANSGTGVNSSVFAYSTTDFDIVNSSGLLDGGVTYLGGVTADNAVRLSAGAGNQIGGTANSTGAIKAQQINFDVAGNQIGSAAYPVILKGDTTIGSLTDALGGIYLNQTIGNLQIDDLNVAPGNAVPISLTTAGSIDFGDGVNLISNGGNINLTANDNINLVAGSGVATKIDSTHFTLGVDGGVIAINVANGNLLLPATVNTGEQSQIISSGGNIDIHINNGSLNMPSTTGAASINASGGTGTGDITIKSDTFAIASGNTIVTDTSNGAVYILPYTTSADILIGSGGLLTESQLLSINASRLTIGDSSSTGTLTLNVADGTLQDTEFTAKILEFQSGQIISNSNIDLTSTSKKVTFTTDITTGNRIDINNLIDLSNNGQLEITSDLVDINNRVLATGTTQFDLTATDAEFNPGGVGNLIKVNGNYTVSGNSTFDGSGITEFESSYTNSTGQVVRIQNGATALFDNGYQQSAGQTIIESGGLLDDVLNSTSFNGGELRGNGTISSNVTMNNTSQLIPGASPGLLTISGDLTLNSGSHLLPEIQGTSRGVTYDAIDVNGNVTINNAIIDIAHSSYSGEAIGDYYNIISSTGIITGSFAQINTGDSSVYTGAIVPPSNQTYKLTLASLSGSGTPPPTDPPVTPPYIVPPTDPVDPPTDPVDPPTDPVDPPTDPVDPPTDPVDPPTDPVDPPTDPVNPPTDPVPHPEPQVPDVAVPPGSRLDPVGSLVAIRSNPFRSWSPAILIVDTGDDDNSDGIVLQCSDL